MVENDGNQVDFNKKNLMKGEGQHLPLAYSQACPHACLCLLDLFLLYIV